MRSSEALSVTILLRVVIVGIVFGGILAAILGVVAFIVQLTQAHNPRSSITYGHAVT